jgi:hypothetical protein
VKAPKRPAPSLISKCRAPYCQTLPVVPNDNPPARYSPRRGFSTLAKRQRMPRPWHPVGSPEELVDEVTRGESDPVGGGAV